LNENNQTGECGYKSGMLPGCAPLAAAYVPMQQENPPKYETNDALTRGTLFPGLDLPFMNMPNKDNPYAGTPLGELMALDFAIKELNLYLDTHPKDKDAFDMMKSLIALYQEGKMIYAKKYGPLGLSCLVYSDTYRWTDSPWPWQYSEGEK